MAGRQLSRERRQLEDSGGLSLAIGLPRRRPCIATPRRVTSLGTGWRHAEWPHHHSTPIEQVRQSAHLAPRRPHMRDNEALGPLEDHPLSEAGPPPVFSIVGLSLIAIALAVFALV
jgi:hypothetical protein